MEADPNRIEARRTAGLPSGVVAYHLSHSRKKTHSAYGTVKKPRHFVNFRLRGSVVEVLRILHDAQDLRRHIPEG